MPRRLSAAMSSGLEIAIWTSFWAGGFTPGAASFTRVESIPSGSRAEAPRRRQAWTTTVCPRRTSACTTSSEPQASDASSRRPLRASNRARSQSSRAPPPSRACIAEAAGARQRALVTPAPAIGCAVAHERATPAPIVSGRAVAAVAAPAHASRTASAATAQAPAREPFPLPESPIEAGRLPLQGREGVSRSGLRRGGRLGAGLDGQRAGQPLAHTDRGAVVARHHLHVVHQRGDEIEPAAAVGVALLAPAAAVGDGQAHVLAVELPVDLDRRLAEAVGVLHRVRARLVARHLDVVRLDAARAERLEPAPERPPQGGQRLW